jgi:hypothetical protein
MNFGPKKKVFIAKLNRPDSGYGRRIPASQFDHFWREPVTFLLVPVGSY